MAEFDRMARLEEALQETVRRLARMEDRFLDFKYFDATSIQDRIARIETKIDVFWNGLSMDFARLLNPVSQTRDELLARLERAENEISGIKFALREDNNGDAA